MNMMVPKFLFFAFFWILICTIGDTVGSRKFVRDEKASLGHDGGRKFDVYGGPDGRFGVAQYGGGSAGAGAGAGLGAGSGPGAGQGFGGYSPWACM